MWTQADIDALKAAIRTGVRSVRYADGREVTYQTLADMRALLGEMIEQVANGGSAPPRTSVARHNRF